MADKLTRSILGTMAGYFAFQTLLFLGFALSQGFFAGYSLLFFVLTVLFDIFLCALLLVFKGDFVLELTGQALDHINLANRITLFRITTLPTLLVLIMAARDYRIRIPLLALVVIVFLSDFADGYVSRKRGQVTRVGRMMDSASDYSLLVVLTVVFYYFTIIPLWFFVLVVARLFIQSALMALLFLIRHHVEPKTTLMGKVAVASIMILYALEIAKIALSFRYAMVFAILEWAAGLIVAASVLDKILAFVRELQAGSGPGPIASAPES